MIYILAGSHRDAHFYAREAGLAPQSWRYAPDERSLLGTHGQTIVVYETFWRLSWARLWPLWALVERLQALAAADVFYAEARLSGSGTITVRSVWR